MDRVATHVQKLATYYDGDLYELKPPVRYPVDNDYHTARYVVVAGNASRNKVNVVPCYPDGTAVHSVSIRSSTNVTDKSSVLQDMGYLVKNKQSKR